MKRVLQVLPVFCVMTFVSGFLQETRFNVFDWLSLFLVCIGGMASIRRPQATRTLRWSLFLTGPASILLLIFFLGDEWSGPGGQMDLEAAMDSLLCGLTLWLCILVIGSLLLLQRLEARPMH